MAYSVVPGLAENVFLNETDPGRPQEPEGFPRPPVVRKPLPSRSIPSPAFPDQSSPLVSQVSSDEPFGSRINEELSYRESSILKRLSGRFLINQQMSGGHLQIVLAYLATSLPILLLAAVLLGLIYVNHLPSVVGLNDDGSVRHVETCKDGIFVNYPATRLTFVSSLISTTAAYMSLPIMTLASFPISRGLIRDSKRFSQTALPSPYQSNLLISLLAGGLNSLWNTAEYLIFWRKKRVQVYRAVTTCTIILGVMVILSLLCQLADIWFHNATSSEVYTSTTPSDAPINYGRQLSARCVQYYKNYIYSPIGELGPLSTNFSTSRVPCNVIVADINFSATNLSEGYQLASTSTSNLSNINLVYNAPIGQSGPAMAVLLPAGAPSDADWQANTVGVSSVCQTIGLTCVGKDGTSRGIPYNCSGSTVLLDVYGDPFAGVISQGSMAVQALKSDTWNLPNPYIVAIAGAIAVSVQTDNPIFASPEVLESGDFPAVILTCNTSVWDISYRSVNGTILVDKATLSNLNVSQTVSGPLIATADFEKSIPLTSLSDSLATSMMASRSIDEFLSKFAAAYSQVTLSYAAGAFDAIPGTSSMISSTKIVACVSIAPLWSLMALAGIYFLLGTCFAVVALSTTLSGDNVRSVQAQLSIAGLTAAGFEQRPLARSEQKVERVEELFKEYYQGHDGGNEKDWTVEGVGFTRNAGGHWEFSTQRTA